MPKGIKEKSLHTGSKVSYNKQKKTNVKQIGSASTVGGGYGKNKAGETKTHVTSERPSIGGKILSGPPKVRRGKGTPLNGKERYKADRYIYDFAAYLRRILLSSEHGYVLSRGTPGYVLLQKVAVKMLVLFLKAAFSHEIRNSGVPSLEDALFQENFLVANAITMTYTVDEFVQLVTTMNRLVTKAIVNTIRRNFRTGVVHVMFVAEGINLYDPDKVKTGERTKVAIESTSKAVAPTVFTGLNQTPAVETVGKIHAATTPLNGNNGSWTNTDDHENGKTARAELNALKNQVKKQEGQISQLTKKMASQTLQVPESVLLDVGNCGKCCLHNCVSGFNKTINTSLGNDATPSDVHTIVVRETIAYTTCNSIYILICPTVANNKNQVLMSLDDPLVNALNDKDVTAFVCADADATADPNNGLGYAKWKKIVFGDLPHPDTDYATDNSQVAPKAYGKINHFSLEVEYNGTEQNRGGTMFWYGDDRHANVNENSPGTIFTTQNAHMANVKTKPILFTAGPIVKDEARYITRQETAGQGGTDDTYRLSQANNLYASSAEGGAVLVLRLDFADTSVSSNFVLTMAITVELIGSLVEGTTHALEPHAEELVIETNRRIISSPTGPTKEIVKEVVQSKVRSSPWATKMGNKAIEAISAGFVGGLNTGTLVGAMTAAVKSVSK